MLVFVTSSPQSTVDIPSRRNASPRLPGPPSLVAMAAFMFCRLELYPFRCPVQSRVFGRPPSGPCGAYWPLRILDVVGNLETHPMRFPILWNMGCLKIIICQFILEKLVFSFCDNELVKVDLNETRWRAYLANQHFYPVHE